MNIFGYAQPHRFHPHCLQPSRYDWKPQHFTRYNPSHGPGVMVGALPYPMATWRRIRLNHHWITATRRPFMFPTLLQLPNKQASFLVTYRPSSLLLQHTFT